MTALIVTVGFVGVIFMYSIWSGFALSVLWRWFFVPTLGLPEISIPAAIGIAITVNYMTHQYQPAEEEDEIKRLRKLFVTMLLKPAMALFIGWLVKKWA